MWLPGPVYESLPYAYIGGGALFVAGTLYVGPDAPNSTLYLALGGISIVSGIFVLLWRRRSRGPAPKTASKNEKFDDSAEDPAGLRQTHPNQKF